MSDTGLTGRSAPTPTGLGVVTPREPHLFAGCFHAMASPCEVLLDTDDEQLAQRVLEVVMGEVLRIQNKYSRYRKESFLSFIAQNAGRRVALDEETSRLLAFADELYQLSEGLFDISSGILCKAWTFDGSANVPSAQTIKALLPLVGWDKVTLTPDAIVLPPGMALDLGGIGKEYAVDRAFALVETLCDCAFVVNLGGDLRTKGPRREGALWAVGIEDPAHPKEALRTLAVSTTALATSGDAKRFLEADGVRYSHLLNPKTGWPVRAESGVRCVSVAAPTCTMAGMLTSLSLLSPLGPAAFLQAQDESSFSYWCFTL